MYRTVGVGYMIFLQVYVGLKKVVKLTGTKVVNMQLSRVKSEMLETTKPNSPAKSDVSCFI